MAVDDSDYLSWYSAEISRYRDHEWRLVSFAIGFSSVVVLFTRRAIHDILPPWIAGGAVAVCFLLLLAAQVHTHLRLNEFRERQNRLLNGSDHRTLECTVGHFCNGWIDCIYFLAFMLVSLLFGVGASYVLFKM